MRGTRRGVELVWADADRYQRLGYLAAAGLLAAVVMALVGLPPVDLHGPLHYLGAMDPPCGMTRDVVAVVRGRLATAVAYNPASPALVAGAVGTLLRLAVGRRTGRWLEVRVGCRRLAIVLLTLALLALWANQQRHAGLLREPVVRDATLNSACAGPAGGFTSAAGPASIAETIGPRRDGSAPESASARTSF